MKMKGLT